MAHSGRNLIIVLLWVISLQTFAGSELALVEAAKNQYQHELQALLQQDVNVNTAEADGTTALHWAAHWNDLEAAELLLAAGADAGPSNNYGVTPLWLACTNQSAAMVSKLLQAGADPNAKLVTGETILMKCAQTGATAAVEMLLNSEADANASELRKGQTALMWASAGSHSDVVASLLQFGAYIGSQSKQGFTPLMFAARAGDLDSTRLLLAAGADPNESTIGQGNALVIASASGHEQLALYLLANGTTADSADQNGITALHHAVRRGMAALNGIRYDPVFRKHPSNMHKLVKALLDAGANPNAQIARQNRIGPDGSPFSMQGATPFLLAAISADVTLLQMLHEYGADPNIKGDGDTTPLMAAARAACPGSCAFAGGNKANNEDIELSLKAVKLLVEMGVDVNDGNTEGRTAIHMAAFTGADKVVQYLAAQGANVNVKDINGETPWSMASGISPGLRYRGLYGSHQSTADLLLQLGAERVTLEEMNSGARHAQ